MSRIQEKQDDSTKSASKSEGQSRPNRSQRRTKSKDKPKFYSKTKGSNDLSWHSPDRELLDRAGTIPWSYQAGELIDLSKPIGARYYEHTPSYAAQGGIFIIREQLAIGGAGFTSPDSDFFRVNQPTYAAANSLLTTMRSRTRVRNTYDAPDVLMLMYAMANIYATVSWYKRLASTVRMYTYQNHYMPSWLLWSQGVNAEDFARNQFTFVTKLNVLISEINKVYIPSRMHLFELYNQRFSGYYTEGSSIKDQLYVFTPAFLNKIEYNPSEDYASWVKPFVCVPGTVTRDSNNKVIGTKFVGNATYTADDLIAFLSDMIDAVITHDSTADITGDMENAFGAGDRFILADCDPNNVSVPILDEEILETIHNIQASRFVTSEYINFDSTVEGYNSPAFATVQSASDNRIGTYDCFVHTISENDENLAKVEQSFTIVDVHKDPSAEKTFAITRLRNFPKRVSKDETNIYIQLEFGCDLICQMQVVDIHMGSDNQPVCYRHPYENVTVNNADGRHSIIMSSPFHYRPLTRFVSGSFVPTAGEWYVGESDIYSFIPDVETLENMNRISLLTLLGAYNNV